MKKAYILAAYRTPGCRANKGGFKDMRPDDLAAAAIKGLVERTGIDPMKIDDVLIGCAFPEGEQGMNFARIAVHEGRASLPGTGADRQPLLLLRAADHRQRR